MKIGVVREDVIRKKLGCAIHTEKSLSCEKVVQLSKALDQIIIQQMRELNNLK